MANDAQSQTIPSWVEDDSYEVQSKVTYAINTGHPSPCSATQFKTFWKGLYDNVVVRSGKIQDNTHMDTMYLVDNQRGHHGESKIPSGPPSGVPLVARCAAASLFSQTTVVPAEMFNVEGI